MQEEALRFSSKSGLFSFDYPSSWLLAYDRSKGNPAGPQVLLGDFKNVDTVSVRRLQDAAQRFSGDSVDPLQVAQFVTEDMRLSAQTLKYNMMKADRISPGR